jgi:hypothetical protein
MNDENDWDERWTANMTILFDALKAQGVGIVTVSYQGGGDSGDTEYPVFERDESDPATSIIPLNHGEWPSGTISQSVRVWDERKRKDVYRPDDVGIKDAVTGLAMELVGRHHGGWENNEGGEGTVTFDVVKRKVELHHGNNIITTEWHDDEFQL